MPPCVEKKPCTSWGIVVTQADALFSDAHSTSRRAFGVIDVSTSLTVACWHSLRDFLISDVSCMNEVSLYWLGGVSLDDKVYQRSSNFPR